MLDRISKIATIIAASAAIAVFIIGGIAWAIRIDATLAVVQSDVAQLQRDVAELRGQMDEVRENQRLILHSLEGLRSAISNHTHDADGRAQIPLTDR